MLERPIASPNWIQEKTRLSAATVNACLRELEQIGIVKEVTGQKRNRLVDSQRSVPVFSQRILPETECSLHHYLK